MPKAKRTRKLPTGEGVVALVEQYLHAKAQADMFDDRVGQLKQRLMDIVRDGGETDDKGHAWFELAHVVEGPEGKKFEKLQRQRRVSQRLDPDAAERILKRRKLWDQCSRMERVLDEDAVLAAGYEGKLSEAELSEIITESESFAFVMK